MPKTVSFQLRSESSERLTVKSLIDFLERTLEWLKSLDPDQPADWRVIRCRTRPPYRFTFANEASNGSVSNRMREWSGFAKPSRRTKLPPMRVGDVNSVTLTTDRDSFLKDIAGTTTTRFSEQEIDSANRLAEAIGSQGELRISSPGDPTVKITPVVASKIKTIAKAMRTDSHVEWTSVRGMLYQITAADNMHRFKIRNHLSGSPVECTFSQELLDRVKDCLKGRVEVFGRARMNKLGQPTSIDVERLRSLPAIDIDLDDLVGIDITAGVSSSEHVERLRNAH
jgi:hypothetical protein